MGRGRRARNHGSIGSSDSSVQQVEHERGSSDSSLQFILDGGSSVDTMDLIRGKFDERPNGFEFVVHAQGE